MGIRLCWVSNMGRQRNPEFASVLTRCSSLFQGTWETKARRELQELKKIHIQAVTPQDTQYIKGVEYFLKAVLVYSAKPRFKFMTVEAVHCSSRQRSFGD